MTIPGPTALPILGATIPFLRDPYGTYFEARARFGNVFRMPVLGRKFVVLAGPDALEWVLTDPDRIFSAREGLRTFAPIFSGGLLHRDAEDHRDHRRLMQPAFKAEAMRGYLALMNKQVASVLDEWPMGKPVRIAPLIKDMVLRMAARVFLGLNDQAVIDRFCHLFAVEIAGTTAIVRRPLPFTRMGRAVAARRELATLCTELIAQRRARGSGDDLLSRLCEAGEDGALTDDEIIDHLNFLMAAAHDAVTGTLIVMAWAMGRDETLQDGLAAEVAALPTGPLEWDDLPSLDLTDRTMREALRRFAPSGFTARRAMKSFQWDGREVPAGTDVAICPGPVMMDPDHWPDPERFDPARFGRTVEAGHRFAWAPFGGGAHKCIGMNFSSLQIKVVITHWLRRARIELDPRDEPRWRLLPTPVPVGNLPLTLKPR